MQRVHWSTVMIIGKTVQYVFGEIRKAIRFGFVKEFLLRIPKRLKWNSWKLLGFLEWDRLLSSKRELVDSPESFPGLVSEIENAS